MAGDLRHRLHPVDVYKVRTRVTGDGSTFAGGACCRTVEVVEGGVNVVVMLFPLFCRTFILDTFFRPEHKSRMPYKLRVLSRNLTTCNAVSHLYRSS